MRKKPSATFELIAASISMRGCRRQALIPLSKLSRLKTTNCLRCALPPFSRLRSIAKDWQSQGISECHPLLSLLPNAGAAETTVSNQRVPPGNRAHQPKIAFRCRRSERDTAALRCRISPASAGPAHDRSRTRRFGPALGAGSNPSSLAGWRTVAAASARARHAHDDIDNPKPHAEPRRLDRIERSAAPCAG